MKLPIMPVVAITISIILSSCTATQYDHHFKEGYKFDVKSVFVKGYLSDGPKGLNTDTFTKLVEEQLKPCVDKTITEVELFDFAAAARGHKGFRVGEKELYEKHDVDAVVGVLEFKRDRVGYYKIGDGGPTSYGEVTRHYKVWYHDNNLRETVWRSNIVIQSRPPIGFFGPNQKAQHLSDAIIKNMAKDGIFADCRPISTKPKF